MKRVDVVSEGVRKGAAQATHAGAHTDPPKSFTPSLFAFESRPFLEEPPAFFVAVRMAPPAWRGKQSPHRLDGEYATYGDRAKALSHKIRNKDAVDAQLRG